jgi:hypothetical protein
MSRTLLMALLLLTWNAVQSQRLVITPEIGVQTFSRETKMAQFGNLTYSSRIIMLGAKFQYVSKNGPYLGAYGGYRERARFGNDDPYRIQHLHYRFEAGYQWSLKPMYFSNPANKGLSVQLQPSIGIAYSAPGPGPMSFNTFSANQTFYYLGATAGLGFLFRNRGRELFSLSFAYTKGLYSNAKEADPAYQTKVGNGFSVRLGVPLTVFRRKK